MAGNDALRKEVSRLRSLVTKKVYRVKKNSGAHVGGTRFDPRPKDITVKSMSDKQLSMYRAKFADFLLRDASHQFVPGYSRSVITRKTFQDYKAAEKKANEKKGSVLGMYDNIVMPGQFSETTVKEFAAQRAKKFNHMTDDATYRPSLLHRGSTKIDGEAAARKLTEQQQNQADEKWFKIKIEQGRDAYSKMMYMMGKSDLADKANSLTDEQFGLLLFSTPFMEGTAMKYLASQKELETGHRRAGIDDAIDEAFNDHQMWIDWAAEQHF